MSNTHNWRQTNKEGYNTAKMQDLPPLTPNNALSGQSSVCATVELYLAVWDDLTSGQRRLVSNHLHLCEQCAQVQRLFRGVTRCITHLPETLPSAQVDRTVFDALAVTGRMRGQVRKSEQLVFSLSRQTRLMPYSSSYRGCRFTVVMTLLMLALLASVYWSTHGSLTLETFQPLFNHLHDWLQFIGSRMQ
jgi:hypothetical protein